jgi:hypothetical protein
MTKASIIEIERDPNYCHLALCVHHLIEGGRSLMLGVYVSLNKCKSGGVVYSVYHTVFSGSLKPEPPHA